MTESNATLNEVPALLEERRKYETWLATLEQRRDATPAHVFERVHADYTSRLQRVSEQLAAHRHAIQEERTSVQSRMSLLEAEEQLRRDERAELDLRVHVGELSGSDAEAAFRAVDDTIHNLLAEKEGLTRRLRDLDSLLEDRAIEPAAEQPAAEAPAAETPAPEQAVSAGVADQGGLQTPGGSFDELAFLTEVVGKDTERAGATASGAGNAGAAGTAGSAGSAGSAGIVRSESHAESLLDGLEKPSRTTAREAPLAANVPANTPIVIRTSGAIEQSKTLKCTECGAMNYPTEWYCERCGAELAAL